MAQIIKNRRGSLDRLSSATGSLQKGEILIATGSSNLTGVTNGQGLVFAAVESGSVVAANRVLQGATAPIFSASSYGHLMDGVPFYASSSNTLFLLGADGNEAIDLSGNISDFSSSVSSSFASLSQSVASVTGDFSSSVATSFSASAASITALSASTYHAVFGFGELSSSIEQSISASIVKAESDLNSYSASAATTDSASAASIAALSASVASVTGDFSSSVATSFSASAASQTALSSSVATTISNLSSSIATTDSASAAYAASQLSSVSGAVATTISNLSSSVETSFSASAASQTALSSSLTTIINNVSGAFATSTSASNAAISSLSASVASVTGDFSSSVATSFSASAASQTALSGAVATTITNLSSSVATSFSASAASQTALSASIALTDNTQDDRLGVIESTYATTGSNTFNGNQIVSGSMWITGDVTIYGSSSLVNVTASAVSIGANTIILNTANPGVRFGGIEVIDSGSSQSTGSLLWDSQNNVWLYANPAGAGYASARLIAGPQNTGSLGEEIGLTTTYIPVALGDDHIGDSNVKVVGNEVTIEAGNLYVEGEISASTINGIGNVTDFSSSVSASIASINTNLGSGGSLGGRVAGLEALTGSYATTGSNQFNGDQSVSGSVIVDTFVQTTTLQGTGSLFLKPDVNDSRQIEIYNTSPSDIHIKGINTAYTYLGDDTNYVLIDTNTNSVSITASAYVDIAGIGNVTSYSQSVDSRFSASAYDVSSLSASVASVTGDFSSSVATSFSASNAQIAELSASVASVGGTFSQSVATDFSASNAARVALSASIASDVNTLSQSFDSRIAANDFLDSTYATTGSNVFHGDQTLTGSLSMTGTANFNNAVAVNDSNMNLGNSSSLNLTGGSSIYVAGGGTISGSITGIGNVTLYSTSVDSRFSASAFEVSQLSASVASVGGTFSQSVATDFSASNAAREALSQSVYDTLFWPSTGLSASFSSSIGTLSGSVSSSISQLSSSVSTSIHDILYGDGMFTFGLSGSISSSISQLSSSVSQSIYDNLFNSANPNAISTSFASASAAYSSSAATFVSESIYQNIYFPTSGLSASLDTRISSSKAEYTSFSASAASDLNSVSGAFATSTSASNAAIASLSASVASTTGDFSSSVAGRLNTIETTYATTGSNSFTGSQGILGDVTVSGSVYIEFGQDLVTNHISGNQGRIELGNTDNNINIIAENELRLSATGSGVHVHSTNFSVSPNGVNNNVLVVSASITKVTNEFSASNISGVGNIGAFSQSVDSRLVGLESFEATASNALEFTGSNVTVLGDLLVRGTTTSVNSTTVNIGDNILALNGTGATFGGIQVNDVTSPGTLSGSLLWDSNNNYWIAGQEGSESKVLVAVGDNVFSSSIQTALSGTFGYSTFDTAISTSFSASAFEVAALSSSVASVTGDFSSSVATSFSASAFELSQLSASVASVTGDFSSSVATSFSASAFNLNELSASIYQTDATQSVAINDNSSSFATSISASNFRITILETTIDGGSF